MKSKLNEEVVKALPVPETGNKVHYFAGAVLQGARKSVALFLKILESIIDTANAQDNVAETPLGMVSIDAGPAHEGARSSSQVMQRPVRERFGIWIPLTLVEVPNSCSVHVLPWEARDKR
jgi:hypothetical protein